MNPQWFKWLILRIIWENLQKGSWDWSDVDWQALLLASGLEFAPPAFVIDGGIDE